MNRNVLDQGCPKPCKLQGVGSPFDQKPSNVWVKMEWAIGGIPFQPLQPFRGQRLKENPAPERKPGKYPVLSPNKLVLAPQNAPQRDPKSNKNRFKNAIQRKLKILPLKIGPRPSKWKPKRTKNPAKMDSKTILKIGCDFASILKRLEGQKRPKIQPKWLQKRH